MLKKFFILLFLILAIVMGGMFYVKNSIHAFLQQPIKIDQNALVSVQRGMTLNTVLNQFSQNEWISSTPFIPLMRRLYPELTRLRVGTFEITPLMTLYDALSHLISGKEYQLAITFIEGSTFKEWRAQFNKAEYLEHRTQAMSEAEIAQALGIERDKLEGLFLAETYYYSVGDSDIEILKRAHNQLNSILEHHWQQKQDNLPLKNSYEALILASIIEKETSVESERERVASVFINRLNKRMRLQTDPTVIYGMGDRYDGNIRKKDLREATPYNTYVINGLPPTPIAMPGEASIKAAVNPEESNYLYFVASGSGGHVFSKNLRDHNRAVQQYLKQLRSRK